MKNMRKLFAMVLAVMMVLTLATTAFAADITITGGVDNAEYAAYKLLNATNSENNYAYTLNGTYTAILQTVTGKETEAEIVAYIAELNTDGIRTFADAVYAKIVEGNIAADYTADDDKFENVEQGYYLIAETKVGSTADTYSLVMLDTAGAEDITVGTKENIPTVDKQVQEKNDSTGASSWGESADYDVGDVIDYKIIGTVSDKYANYQSYYYSFSDNMDDGLTLNAASIKVMIGTVDVTSQFDIDTTEHSFTATANLKELTLPEGVAITGETEVIVTYTATLNENAASGATGNENTVVLEYENNPYHKADGNPETPDKPDQPDGPGKTPEDTNIVFTYDLIIDKYTKVGDDKQALAGAGFTLYKQILKAAAVEDDPGTPDVDETAAAVYEWEPVGDEIRSTQEEPLTTFNFNKLDEGKYKLVETTVPAGYNQAADVEFEIVSEMTDNELTNLTVSPAGNFTVDMEAGTIKGEVENKAGSVLPETGGVGTTMFYLFGSVMVLAAVVLLVTKKRMAA